MWFHCSIVCLRICIPWHNSLLGWMLLRLHLRLPRLMVSLMVCFDQKDWYVFVYPSVHRSFSYYTLYTILLSTKHSLQQTIPNNNKIILVKILSTYVSKEIAPKLFKIFIFIFKYLFLEIPLSKQFSPIHAVFLGG